jgi:SulP family sulfate permease
MLSHPIALLYASSILPLFSTGDRHFQPLKDRAWSFQDGRRLIATATSFQKTEEPNQRDAPARKKKLEKGLEWYLYCLIYAVVNVIISAPGLYGYAAVIFNNPVFNNHMNALSKLVIFSSLIHQLGFFLFSSLDFVIGTVQDAGLIFLSSMANTIANRMLEDGHTEQEIVSTTLVLLSFGTAVLGLVLMIMGRFRLADAVAYLPMPVVGGYLAFIGYFCCQAGVALCISQPIMTLGDWKYVFEPKNLMLAVPGLVTGVVLTLTSRLATNSGVLPLVMVSIPALFYMTLYFTGTTLDEVREDSWVGPVAPSVPVGDLFNLVDFRLVRSCMRTSPTLGFVLEKGLD